MVFVPNTFCIFEGANSVLRDEVLKSDGDVCESNRPDNRYVYIGAQRKLIAAVWGKKFVGFQRSTHQTSG
jgi:hypothetical protein